MIRSPEAYDQTRPPRDAPEPRAGVLFVAGVATVFFLGGLTLEMRLGEQGLLAA